VDRPAGIAERGLGISYQAQALRVLLSWGDGRIPSGRMDGKTHTALLNRFRSMDHKEKTPNRFAGFRAVPVGQDLLRQGQVPIGIRNG